MNTFNLIYATDSNENSEEIQKYTVPVISKEYKNSYVTFYEVNKKYYLLLDDIKDFTRCKLKESKDKITLTHGLREIVIEKETGNLIDCELVNQGIINMVKYNGKYLCEGIPMLTYQ